MQLAAAHDSAVRFAKQNSTLLQLDMNSGNKIWFQM